MNPLSAQEIRQQFLDFFAQRGHAVLPSASLVPENDPTVLFNTAGMQPLVPYLLGQKHPEGSRLTSVQKCVRTVDIEDIGDDSHATFFEMLGNWSLGDYWKEESIAWSWEFLTTVLGLEPERLYVTVFAGDADAPRDEESIVLWQRVFSGAQISDGVDLPLEEGGRIFTLSKESNWWGPAGSSGPCGPDTEIFYDLGSGEISLTEKGLPDFEGTRLLEVWNNVFMQYFKDENGVFSLLEQRNVDTGLGLERLSAVLLGSHSIYDSDLFSPVIQYLEQEFPDLAQKKIRIIADHFRAAVFLLSDGVRPSNKDQGYVLRRLIRRAGLYTYEFGKDFVAAIIDLYADIYKDQYPELYNNRQEFVYLITQELEKFGKSIQKGLKELEKLDALTADASFNLYQTFGFPYELSKEYASEHGMKISDEDFAAAFEAHQNLSRTASAGQFKSGLADDSEAVVKYHTTTHLLHQALRQVLGDSVQQKGSNITAERLRFDFSYPEKMTESQKSEVEKRVNAAIAAHVPIESTEMSPDEALASGALGFFGAKYGDLVSVYTMGEYSKEICTGPHVQNTSELGVFRIKKEESASAGVRRIKGVLE